jgi:stalled ribosome rescue protein Dom34
MAKQKRVVIVNGTEYELPKLWEEAEIDSLMKAFEEARNGYVVVHLDDGAVHVLVNPATQISFSIRTPRRSVYEAPD